MMQFQDYIALLRIQQWYKNVVAFIAILFSGRALILGDWALSLVVFFILCILSSGYYIVNDLKDKKKDKLDLFKRKRPIASGVANESAAKVIAASLIFLSLLLALSLNLYFFIIILAILINSILYTFFLKKIIPLNIISIALNFILKALAAVILLGSEISYWLIASLFLLAIFLSSGKRLAEGKVQQYPFIMGLSLIGLIVIYAIYSITTRPPTFLLSIIPASYALVSFMRDASHQQPLARSPEKVLLTTRYQLSIVLWLMIVFSTIYLL